MLSFAIAAKAGITPQDLDDLIKGSVNANVATRLGVNIASIEALISGNQSHAIVASRLGLTMQDVDDLRLAIGREGAIGLILGLLILGS